MELPRRTFGSRMEKNVHVQGMVIAALIIFFGILPTCAYVLPTNGIETVTEENKDSLNDKSLNREFATGDILESSAPKPDLEWDIGVSMKNEHTATDFDGDNFKTVEGKENRVIKTRSVRSDHNSAGANKNPTRASASSESKLKSEKLSRKNTKKETVISKKTSEKGMDSYEKTKSQEEKGARKLDVKSPGGYLTLEERISAWLLAKRKEESDWEDASSETDVSDTRSKPGAREDDSAVLVHVDKMRNYNVDEDPYGNEDRGAPRGYSSLGDFIDQSQGYRYPTGYNSNEDLRRYGISDDADQYKNFLDARKSKRGKNYDKTFGKEQDDYDSVGTSRNIKTNEKPVFFYYYDPESHYAPSGIRSQFQFDDKEYVVEDSMPYEENSEREGKGKRNISPKSNKYPRDRDAIVNSFYTLENYVDDAPTYSKKPSAETINASPLGSDKDSRMEEGGRFSKESIKNGASADVEFSGDMLGKIKTKDGGDLTEVIKKSKNVIQDVVKEKSRDIKVNVSANLNSGNVKFVDDVDEETDMLHRNARQLEMSANSQEAVHKNQGPLLRVEDVNIGNTKQMEDNSVNTSDITSANETTENKTERRSSPEEQTAIIPDDIDQNNVTARLKNMDIDTSIPKSTSANTSHLQNASVSPVPPQKDNDLSNLEKSISEVRSEIRNDTVTHSNGTILIILRNYTTTTDHNEETIPILRNDAEKISVVAKDATPPKSLSNFSSAEQGQSIFPETVKSDPNSAADLFNEIENNGNNGSGSQTTFRRNDTTQAKGAELIDGGLEIYSSNGSLNVLNVNSINLDSPDNGVMSSNTTNYSRNFEDSTMANMSFSHKNITSIELSSSFDDVGISAVHNFTANNSTFQDAVIASVTNATLNLLHNNTENNDRNKSFESNNGSERSDIREGTTRNNVNAAESEKIPTAYMASIVLDSRDHRSALNTSVSMPTDLNSTHEDVIFEVDRNESSTPRKEDIIQLNKVIISSDLRISKSNVSVQIIDNAVNRSSNGSVKKPDITSSQDVFSNNETMPRSGSSGKEHIQISLAEIAPQDDGMGDLGSLGNNSTSKVPAVQISSSRAWNESVESLSEKSLLQHNTVPLAAVPSGKGSTVNDHPLDSDDVQRSSSEDLNLKVMGVHSTPETAKVSTSNQNVTLRYAGNNTWVFPDTAAAGAGISNATLVVQSDPGRDNNSSLTINSPASQSQTSNHSTEEYEKHNKNPKSGPILDIRNSSYSLNIERSNTSLLENDNLEFGNFTENIGKASNFSSNSYNNTVEQKVFIVDQRNKTSVESNISSVLSPQHKTLTTFLSDSNFSRKLMSFSDLSGNIDLNDTKNASIEVDSKNTSRRFVYSPVDENNTTFQVSHDKHMSTLHSNITSDHQENHNSKTIQKESRVNDTLQNSSLNRIIDASEPASHTRNNSVVGNNITSSIVQELMKNLVITNSKKLQSHEPQLQDIGEATNSSFNKLVNGNSNPNHKLENDTSVNNNFRNNLQKDNTTEMEDDSISVENFLKSQSVNSHNHTTKSVSSTVDDGVSNNVVGNISSHGITVNSTDSKDVLRSSVTRREIITSGSQYVNAAASSGGGNSSAINLTSWMSEISKTNGSELEYSVNSSGGNYTNRTTDFGTTMNPGANNLKSNNGSFQISPVGKELQVREAESLTPAGSQTFKSNSVDGSGPSLSNRSSAEVFTSSSGSDVKVDAGRGGDVKTDDSSHFGTFSDPDVAVPPISAYMVQDFSLRKPSPDSKSTNHDGKNTKTGVDNSNGGGSINVDNTISNGGLNNTSGVLSNNTEYPCVGPACDFGLLSVPPRSQAAVSAVLTSHFGPTKDTMIPFDLELLDLADNYDNTTGMFICTIPGTYVISLYLMSHPGAKVNARVFINNRPIAALWADDSKNAGFYPSSSTQTIAQLGFGDQVYVMLVDGGYGDSWVHANYNVFTIFLLYEQVF